MTTPLPESGRVYESSVDWKKPPILRLPPELRLSIYRRVLISPDPQLVCHDEGAPLYTFAPRRPPYWTAVIFVSRQIHDEARKILYEMNVFNVVDSGQRQYPLLRTFIFTIGRTNASSLKHLCIDFHALQAPNMKNPGLDILHPTPSCCDLLHEHCPALSILETYLHKAGLFFGGTIVHSEQAIESEVDAIDAELQRLGALRLFVVRLYTQDVSPAAIESMGKRGWAVLKRHESLPSSAKRITKVQEID